MELHEILKQFKGLDSTGITKKHRELAKRFHPDLPNGSGSIMQLINLCAKAAREALEADFEPAEKYQSVKPESEPEAKPEPAPVKEQPVYSKKQVESLPADKQAEYVQQCLKAHEKALADCSITINLEGTWLWAYGCNTSKGYECLQYLKQIGFRQCGTHNSNKNHAGQWYWSPIVDIRTRPTGRYRSTGKQWEVKSSIGAGNNSAMMLH